MNTRNATLSKANATLSRALAATGAPSLALLGIEPFRAVVEYARMSLMDWHAATAGDGHPVVIFPGLGTDGCWSAPLKGYCSALGYKARDWGRGVNTGPRGDVEQWLADLAADIERLIANHPQRCTLIGWSLGGIYAREVARHLKRRVRQVVTIGSPFAGDCEHTNAGWLYRLLSGQKVKMDSALAQRLRTAPPVPTTSIYSRSDGIVAWQSCVQDGGGHCENVEVSSSHIGLVWNPRVLEVIADRLSQREGAWRPYECRRPCSSRSPQSFAQLPVN